MSHVAHLDRFAVSLLMAGLVACGASRQSAAPDRSPSPDDASKGTSSFPTGAADAARPAATDGPMNFDAREPNGPDAIAAGEREGGRAPAPEAGVGSTNGLTAEYFEGLTLEGRRVLRTDPVIDFDFTATPPPDGTGAGSFRARWTATLDVPMAGEWTLVVTSHDGVRLSVDGEPVIENWHDHAVRDDQTILTLAAGPHGVMVESYAASAGGLVKLAWSGPQRPREVIPTQFWHPASGAAAPVTRDPWHWPYTPASIWNTPIGSSAMYVPANFPGSGISVDTEWLLVASKTAPKRPLFNPGSWTKRCGGTQKAWIPEIYMEDDVIVPDAVADPAHYFTPNNGAAILQPDGHSVVQLEPLARCDKAGPVYGIPQTYPEGDLFKDGRRGTHYGSGLSVLGGSIRKGELTGDAPIRHAIKLLILDSRVHYEAADKGYRWPATNADGAAPQTYKGTVAALRMGALLAVPFSVTERSLGLKTAPAKKLFHALQDYGGYLVDTGETVYVCMEEGAADEFKTKYGYAPATAGVKNDYSNDMSLLVQALQVVDNNTETSIGGGGAPRAPHAPALAP